MTHPSSLALVLAAACGLACATAAPAARKEALRPRADLVAVSRALTALEAAERKGDVVAHRQRLSQAAQAAPRDPAARFLAVSAEPAGEERWAEFRALAAALPDSAFGHLGMARTYVEWNTLDQADRSIAAALEAEPDCWLAVLVRARVAERRERWDAATADYRRVLEVDAESPDAHLGLARAARAAGDAALAGAEATRALAAAPDLHGALALLGDLAAEAGDVAAAADLWEGAVESSPRDRPARVRLAGLLRRKGDAARARDQWRAALELKEDAETLALLAEAARAANDPATEQHALERLSQIDSTATEWRRIAEIRLAADDWGGAEKALRRALARDPKDRRASLALAKVHLARGESTSAVEALRAAGDEGRDEHAALLRRLHVERLSRPDLDQLQRAVQQQVDRAYRERLAVSPSLSGTLKLRASVDAAGAASQVELLEDSVHDADVAACAYWNLRDAAYPPARPGRYAFTFSFRR